jgi:hypothetical protein
LFAYVAMAIAPLAQVTLNTHPAVSDKNLLLPATVLVLVGCIAYDVGSFFGIRLAQGMRESLAAHDRYQVVDEVRLVLLGVVGIIGAACYVYSAGGLTRFFGSREELASGLTSAGLRTDDSEVGSALLTTLGTVPVFIALVAQTCILARRPEYRRPSAYLWWGVLAGANAITNNPISNARYWFLAVAIALLFSFPNFTKVRFRVALITGVSAALLVFPYADYYRNDSTSRAPMARSSVTETLSLKDYDQVIMTANGIWWVGGHGHTLGRQMLGNALFWVPRSQWEDKPVDTGVLIGREMGGPNANLSSPLWIELWIDFGVPGVVTGFLALGIISRRYDTLFERLRDPGRRDTLTLDIALPLFAGYQFILLRGPLLQSMSRLAVIAAVVLLLGKRVERDVDVRKP